MDEDKDVVFEVTIRDCVNNTEVIFIAPASVVGQATNNRDNKP